MNVEQMTTLERKIDRFSSILEQKPGDGLTVLALAEASFRRGLKLEALTAYQEVTKEKPVPEAHLAVAEIYSQQGMLNEAYGELAKLFEIDPENVEARLLAHILTEELDPPDNVAAMLNEPTSDAAFDEARLRLQIQLTIHNRELQERTRNVTLEPGVVVHEYQVEEAKKKLIDVQEMLRKTEELRAFNEQLRMAPPRPEPVSPQPEESSQPVAALAPTEPEQAAQPVQSVPAVSEPVQSTQLLEHAEMSAPPQPEIQESQIATEAEPQEVQSPPREAVPEPQLTLETTPGLGIEPIQSQAPEPQPYQAEIAPEPLTQPQPYQAEATPEPSTEPQDAPAAVIDFETEPQTPAPSLPQEELQLPAQPPVVSTEEAPQIALTPEVFSAEPAFEEPEPAPVFAVEPAQVEYAGMVSHQVEPPQAEPHQVESPVMESEEVDLQAPEPIQVGEAPSPELQSPHLAPAQADSHSAPPSEHTQEEQDYFPAPPQATETPQYVEPAVPEPVIDFTPSIEPELPEPETEPAASYVSEPQLQPEASAQELPEVHQAEMPLEPAFALEAGPVPPQESSSYSMPIEIGVESMIAPDLPDEPIPPAPEIEVTPEAEAPVSMIEPVVEEQAPEPALETILEEPAPVSSGADLAVRQAYYESKAEELGKLTGTLARTRGVTSIFLVSRDGITIDSVVKDEVSEQRIGELVKESFEFLLAYAKSPSYWVLECTGGIFVMQTLDDRHVLIAVGQAGANFGALRYTMDKTKAKFATILDGVPA